MQIEREAQKAQEPSKRVGTGQAESVSTHEGSMLDAPVVAKATEGSTPHLTK